MRNAEARMAALGLVPDARHRFDDIPISTAMESHGKPSYLVCSLIEVKTLLASSCMRRRWYVDLYCIRM